MNSVSSALSSESASGEALLAKALMQVFPNQPTADMTAEDIGLFEQAVNQLSAALVKGDSCLFLYDSASQALFQRLAQTGQWVSSSGVTPLILQIWSGAETPLFALYFRRYWLYEMRLVSHIRQRLQPVAIRLNPERLAALFPVEDPSQTDWQKEAVVQSLGQGMAIISGGPGTGKTTTVIKALALLLEDQIDLTIALAAPTGKAAMRLQSSIGGRTVDLPCSEAVKQAIPQTVVTLHRLLGAIHQSNHFKHHAGNPLPYDVVVVDEASMVDLALMAKLLDALKPQAQLLLLGDKDQLTSVESGSVLADLTRALPEQTHFLHKSHRFSGLVKELAVAVNKQQTDAWRLLQQHGGQQAAIDRIQPELANVVSYAKQAYQSYLRQLAQFDASAERFKALFACLQQFQILCSNRRGPLGGQTLNRELVKALHGRTDDSWFKGRPVMIMQNQAALGVFNGDVGICLPDADGELWVWFEAADGEIRRFLPSRLPQNETAYAMTIHKSQGSEFDEVLIVLDQAKENPIMTKELVYTAITRAKQRAVLATHQAAFISALGKKVSRQGGLVPALTQVDSFR